MPTGTAVRARTTFAALLVLAAFAPRAGADAFRYTDERGVVHFTDNAPTVPERYREGLERIELERTTEERAEARSRAPRHEHPGVLAQRLLAAENWKAMDTAAQAWLDTWGTAYLVSGVPWGIVMFAVWIHTFRRRRFLWLISNVLLWPISVPGYLLFRFDPFGLAPRLGMLAAFSAPFVVGGLALRAATRMFTA